MSSRGELRFARVFGLVCVAGSIAAAVSGQNLLLNPDFDDDITAWEASLGALAWSAADDIDGCDGSGAARIDDAELDGGVFKLELVSGGSCVDVTPGEEIAVHIRMFPLVSGNSTEVALITFTDDACSAGEAEQPMVGYGPLPSLWLNLMLGSTIQTGVQSMRLLVRSSDPALSTIASRFDQIYVGRGFRLFSDTFEAGSLCRWTTTSP